MLSVWLKESKENKYSATLPDISQYEYLSCGNMEMRQNVKLLHTRKYKKPTVKICSNSTIGDRLYWFAWALMHIFIYS